MFFQLPIKFSGGRETDGKTGRRLFCKIIYL